VSRPPSDEENPAFVEIMRQLSKAVEARGGKFGHLMMLAVSPTLCGQVAEQLIRYAAVQKDLLRQSADGATRAIDIAALECIPDGIAALARSPRTSGGVVLRHQAEGPGLQRTGDDPDPVDLHRLADDGGPAH
jgi:hypothetical protein